MVIIYFKKLRLPIQLALLWFAIALVSVVVSAIFMIHNREVVSANDIFLMSFYHFVPAVVWSIITPLILRLLVTFPLKGNSWKTNLIYHVIISILSAPVIRYLSILLDFSIKSWTGIMDAPPFEVVNSVLLVIVASTPRAILYYWIVVGAYYLSKYVIIKNQDPRVKKFLTVDKNNSKVLVRLEDVFWIEASGNYVHINTDKEKYSLRITVKEISQQLDDRFLRVHRSFIANKENIESLKHWRRGEYLIVMKNLKTLTSSRTYKANIDLLLQV